MSGPKVVAPGRLRSRPDPARWEEWIATRIVTTLSLWVFADVRRYTETGFDLLSPYVAERPQTLDLTLGWSRR